MIRYLKINYLSIPLNGKASIVSDEAGPETVINFTEMIPNAKFALIPGSGHTTLNDNGPAVLAAIQQFLKTIEKK